VFGFSKEFMQQVIKDKELEKERGEEKRTQPILTEFQHFNVQSLVSHVLFLALFFIQRRKLESLKRFYTLRSLINSLELFTD
jgi:hypothetical protein